MFLFFFYDYIFSGEFRLLKSMNIVTVVAYSFNKQGKKISWGGGEKKKNKKKKRYWTQYTIFASVNRRAFRGSYVQALAACV